MECWSIGVLELWINLKNKMMAFQILILHYAIAPSLLQDNNDNAVGCTFSRQNPTTVIVAVAYELQDWN
jgi:hypothetical protein